MDELPPPSPYRQQRMMETMQEIQHMNEVKYVTDAVVGLLANEGFALVCVFLAYRFAQAALVQLARNGWLKRGWTRR